MTDHNGFKIRKCEHVAKGYLAHAGNRSERLYVLRAGLIARERVFTNGLRQIVGLHVAGDTCGLDALPDGRSHYDLRALSPVSFVPIDRKELLSAARTSDEFSAAIRMELAREIAIAGEWITNLGLRPALQRIAHLACELAARQPVASDASGDKVEWPGTQADLAAAMGLSVVHVNRTLMQLVKERVLSDGRRTLFNTLTKLQSIASFDGSYLAFDGTRLGALLVAGTEDAVSERSGFGPQSRGAYERVHAVL